MSHEGKLPADGITLRDVIDHINHKFDVVETRSERLEHKVEKGFAAAARERAEMLRRVDAEANVADDKLSGVATVRHVCLSSFRGTKFMQRSTELVVSRRKRPRGPHGTSTSISDG